MSHILEAFLTTPESRSPVFLDGHTIAMISTQTGDPQIWTLDLKNGLAQQRTFGHERIWRIASDRASRSLVFCMDKGGNENEQVFLLRCDGDGPFAVTDVPAARHLLSGIHGDKLYYADNARASMSFDICETDLVTGQKRVILENNDHYNWPAEGGLSPNGQWLLYNKLLGESNNALWMVNTVSGEARRIAPDSEISSETCPAWQPDSNGFFLLTNREGEFTSVAHYDLGLCEFTSVLKYNWDVQSLALSDDGRYLAVVVNEDGYSDLHIYQTAAKDLTEVSIHKPESGLISPYQSMDWFEHKLLFTLSTADMPENIWVLDLDNGSLEQITQHEVRDVSRENMCCPELLRFSSFDGLQVPYWLYVPKGFVARDLPIVIDIHGGPEGQEVPGFNPFVQYLLSQKIAVVAPNIRGSTGYGKTYTHLDDVEKRLDSIRDIEELVRHLVSSGIADPERIAVMGMSYGGFMTLSCAARLPDLWACAIDTVGMFNLESFLENTAPYRRAHRESEYGSLEKHRKLLYEISPIAKVDDIKAPLMVIHGKNDPRVPVSEAEQVVERLRQRNVLIEYLCYEDEGHGISKLTNKLDCYPNMASFLQKHLNIT